MRARENPFRTARVLTAIRYALPASEPDASRDGALALLPRLEALGHRAAIVGPHGSGKTTLLEDLEHVLAARGFRVEHLRLDTEAPRLPVGWTAAVGRLGPRDILCVDGAEQLGPLRWLALRWCARRAGGLLVTTHRAGRLPTLIACTTDPVLLDRIVRRLTDGQALAAPSAEDILARHRGNVREALRELYDVYAAAR